MANQKTLMQAKEAIDLLLQEPNLSAKVSSKLSEVATKLAEEAGKDEADQFWSEDNPENCCNDAHELALEIADNLIAGEEATLKVWCSKRLPNRKMFVTVTEENDTREVVWRWIEDKPESSNEQHQIGNL